MQQRNCVLKSSMSGLLLAGLFMVTGGGSVWAQQNPAVVPDAQVEANVLKALASQPQLADQPISTTTVYGEVTLSGTVRDEASRDMAEKLASDAPGVKKVIDQLAIGTVAAGESAPPQGQDSSPEGTNPVLQSDGTYAPQQSAQDQGNPDPDQGDNAAAGEPPMGEPPMGGPPQQEGQNQPGPYGGPYGSPPPPPYGQQPPPPPYGQQPASPYGQQQFPQAYARPDGRQQQGGESVVVPSGTLLRVRINQGMDSKNTTPGTVFDGVVLSDVIAGNMVAIPRGTAVQGRVESVQNADALKGRGGLALRLTQITLGGQIYPVVSDAWTHQGADKTSQTVGNAVGLGAMGALIGAVAGGGPGALLGAGIGGVAGVGASAASRRGEAMVPPEAILTFHLAQQVPVTTVSQAEMNRLASGVQPGMHQMRRREPPPPYYNGPAYYPY